MIKYKIGLGTAMLALLTGCHFDGPWLSLDDPSIGVAELPFNYEITSVMRAVCIDEGVKDYGTLPEPQGFRLPAQGEEGQIRPALGCDTACHSALLVHGYDFIEAYNPTDIPRNSQRRPPEGLVYESGWYRFERAERGAPGCEIYEAINWGEFTMNPGPERRVESNPYYKYCIRSFLIDQPTSKYVMRRMPNKMVKDYPGTNRYTFSRSYGIYHEDTGEPVAEYTTFLSGRKGAKPYPSTHLCTDTVPEMGQIYVEAMD